MSFKIGAIFVATLVILAVFIFIKINPQNTSTSKLPTSTTSEVEKNSSESGELITSKLLKAPLIEVVASNLRVPWAIAFLSSNEILVTERNGTLKKVSSGNVTTIAKIAEVKEVGEGGLLGVAVDPDFSSNNYIYLYFTFNSSGNKTINRVVRYKFLDNKLSELKIVSDNIPGALFHNGGRIRFGPDKALYITTGDAQEPSLSQNRDSLAGKILKVEDEKIEVFSLGHRNPQGLAWDESGKLWEVEHGSSAHDEINLIEQGSNYGWPDVIGNATKPGITSAILESGNNTWAPSGLAFFDGKLYFSGLRGSALFVYDIDQKKLNTYLENQFGRLRESILGPDGNLYLTTSNLDGRGVSKENDDKIIKINLSKLK